jgi:hypothetical protein
VPRSANPVGECGRTVGLPGIARRAVRLSFAFRASWVSPVSTEDGLFLEPGFARDLAILYLPRFLEDLGALQSFVFYNVMTLLLPAFES